MERAVIWSLTSSDGDRDEMTVAVILISVRTMMTLSVLSKGRIHLHP